MLEKNKTQSRLENCSRLSPTYIIIMDWMKYGMGYEVDCPPITFTGIRMYWVVKSYEKNLQKAPGYKVNSQVWSFLCSRGLETG